MVVTTTTAASLAAGSALEGLAPDARDRSIVLLTLLTGVVIIALGVLRLGRFVRFVSRSVMLGFLTGVAVNILLGQLPDLTGVTPPSGVAAQKAWYVITHPGEIVWPAAAIGVAALLTLIVLGRTRFSLYGSLVAVVVPSALFAWLAPDAIDTVDDAGDIPSGMPPLVLPQLSDLSVGVVIGALSIAAIVVVQGAGVAESAPNPDGSHSSTNRDFIGQGVANVASGLFHGTPVGGSVTTTSLNITAGARSRWGSIFAGLWMLIILLALSELVGLVLMPTLAAVLIYAAARALKFLDMLEVWRTAHTGKLALMVTFIATLALPVSAAVAVGLICSLLLQLNKEALDLRVVQLEPMPDGRLAERPAPKILPGGQAARAGRLRQPALRGLPHPRRPAARPARRGAPDARAQAARPDVPRLHVLRRGLRLRRGDGRVRGTTLPVRRLAGHDDAVRGHARRRPRRRRAPVRGHRGDRRVHPRGLCRRPHVARRAARRARARARAVTAAL